MSVWSIRKRQWRYYVLNFEKWGFSLNYLVASQQFCFILTPAIDLVSSELAVVAIFKQLFTNVVKEHYTIFCIHILLIYIFRTSDNNISSQHTEDHFLYFQLRSLKRQPSRFLEMFLSSCDDRTFANCSNVVKGLTLTFN